MYPLSAVIITFNEEHNIERCIRSVREVADEIIVLDSFSTDETPHIARSLGATVYQEKFRGYIGQKNFAIKLASHNYILSLDADETLDPKLVSSILEVKKTFAHRAYSMNRCTNFCGRFIRHGLWYPDRKTRLFDRTIAKWGGLNPHDKIQLQDNFKPHYLEGDILHYSFTNAEDLVWQNNRLSSIAATSLYTNGKRSSWLKMLVNPAWAFINGYIFRRGFLDGFDGLRSPSTRHTRFSRNTANYTGCIIQRKARSPTWPNRYCPEQKLLLEKVESYPLVTVVIPTYNRAPLLKKAIDSVLSQTYPNIELIIADDQSTDDTVQMVYSIGDPRIRLVELTHSGNVSTTRNAGVRVGSGKWIAFLDSDDIWLPQKIELQVKKMRETGKRWCYSGFELTDESGNIVPPKAGRYEPLSGWITPKLLTNEATAVICTVILERTLFEEAGEFNSEARLHRCDFEFILRVSRKAVALALPDTLVRVLEHDGRSTRSLAAAYEHAIVPYDIFLELETDPALRKIARRQKAIRLSEAAVRRSERKQYSVALNQLIRSATTDHWRHWCSAVYRSFKTLFKKQKPAHP